MHLSLVYFEIALTILLIAGSYIFSKHLANASTPETLAMLRFALATLCYLPIVQWRAVKKFSWVDLGYILLAAFFGFFGYSSLFFNAIKYTSPINIALINATIPIMSLLVSIIIWQKLPTRIQFAAFVLSFTGVALTVTKGNFTQSLESIINKGDLLMLAAACSWVLYGFIIKKILDKKPDTLLVTALASFFGFVMLLAWGLATKTITVNHFNLTKLQTISIFYIGTSTALFAYLYSKVVNHLNPKMANFFIFSLVPIVTAFFSYIFLGIGGTIWQLLGGMLVLTALAINRRN